MNFGLSIIKADYLQRTRSYSFLVTLAISLYLAYAFVPSPDANYYTVRVDGYVGVYNSAWIGVVTAMMTSVFLFLFGFFLVNSSIKRDIETEVGMIIATTPISNFSYLLYKMLSNFLVLLTITGIVFVMAVVLFFSYSTGYSFEIAQFILPYLLITLPTIFFVSALSIMAEVIFGRRSVLQYIAFFIVFNILVANSLVKGGASKASLFDPFGTKLISYEMTEFVKANYDESVKGTSIGFIFGENKKITSFVFEGVYWPVSFIASRVGWIVISVLLIMVSSRFFHRFDLREVAQRKKGPPQEKAAIGLLTGSLKLEDLPALTPSFGIVLFIKTELLMLFRKGPRWFWLINLGIMVAMLFAPLAIAHTILLPILWFMQVGRLSELVTKEKTYRLHHFTFASYQPLRRLLLSQVIAGILLTVTLALPLWMRYLFLGEIIAGIWVISGAIFIVLLAVCLGLMSGGKKLFEVFFFLVTYSNLNRIPILDYFGATNPGLPPLGILGILILLLAVTSLMIRRYEVSHGG